MSSVDFEQIASALAENDFLAVSNERKAEHNIDQIERATFAWVGGADMVLQGAASVNQNLWRRAFTSACCPARLRHIAPKLSS
jgi:hypothetical protein